MAAHLWAATPAEKCLPPRKRNHLYWGQGGGSGALKLSVVCPCAALSAALLSREQHHAMSRRQNPTSGDAQSLGFPITNGCIQGVQRVHVHNMDLYWKADPDLVYISDGLESTIKTPKQI